MKSMFQVPAVMARRQFFTGQIDSWTAGGTRPECSVAGLSHDVRNMLTALNLYCDLLSEPAVLGPSYRHYAEELRLVARAGNSLLERLTHLAAPQSLARLVSMTPPSPPQSGDLLLPHLVSDALPRGRHGNGEAMIRNLASELQGCHNLLAALAGPSIRVLLDCGSYAGSFPLNREDLIRILINLVRNACEAMPNGGEIRIAVAGNVWAESIVLSIEDDGPGIAASDLRHLFEDGYTTKRRGEPGASGTAPTPHGQGLAIVRGLVQSAGGRVRASSPAGRGARFEITLPRPMPGAGNSKDVAVQDTDLGEGIRVQC